jgi:hypothetical protein
VKTRHLLVALVVANQLTTAPPTLALSIMGHQIKGIVRKVDVETREAELFPAGKTKPLRFTWDSQTKFVTGLQRADASILRPGALVEIHCYRPFFGETYVRKVTLLSESQRRSKKHPLMETS